MCPRKDHDISETLLLSFRWTNDIVGPKEPAQDEQVLALDVLEAPERDYTPIDKVKGWQDPKKIIALLTALKKHIFLNASHWKLFPVPPMFKKNVKRKRNIFQESL